jgi:hypothetical protein
LADRLPSCSKGIIICDIYLQGIMQDCGLEVSNCGWNKSIQLNIENLPEGFYTVQIINNKTGRSEVGKFVKIQ